MTDKDKLIREMFEEWASQPNQTQQGNGYWDLSKHDNDKGNYKSTPVFYAFKGYHAAMSKVLELVEVVDENETAQVGDVCSWYNYGDSERKFGVMGECQELRNIRNPERLEVYGKPCLRKNDLLTMKGE